MSDDSDDPVMALLATQRAVLAAVENLAGQVEAMQAKVDTMSEKLAQLVAGSAGLAEAGGADRVPTLGDRFRTAYPIDDHSAKLLTLSATILDHLVDAALVRLRVDQVLHRSDPDFLSNLKFNLRLLREAFGDAHIFGADLTDEEYTRIQQVDWELLPPGWSDKILARLAAQKSVGAERLRVAEQRLQELDRLGHDGFIVGTGRFARYFGAKFGDRLVALESLEYGNALYLFEENWEHLTQLSRTELIKRRDPLVHRVPHLPGWQSAIRHLVRQRI